MRLADALCAIWCLDDKLVTLFILVDKVKSRNSIFSLSTIIITELSFVLLFSFNRYTILETGPVETPILQTLEDRGKAIDPETADQKTKKLKEKAGEALQQLISKDMAKSSKIAATVQDIILGQKTNFRCYTSAVFHCDEIAAKLKDPATNELINRMGKQYFDEK